jgi:hypothetical protein
MANESVGTCECGKPLYKKDLETPLIPGKNKPVCQECLGDWLWDQPIGRGPVAKRLPSGFQEGD